MLIRSHTNKKVKRQKVRPCYINKDFIHEKHEKKSIAYLFYELDQIIISYLTYFLATGTGLGALGSSGALGMLLSTLLPGLGLGLLKGIKDQR